MSTQSTVTLGSLRTQSRQRADMVNSNFITDSEFNAYISLSYKELYDLLVATYGPDYYVATPYQFQTDGQTMMFPLPSDFYKLLGVDLSFAGTGQGAQQGFVTINQFNFRDRNRYAVPNFQSFYGVTNLRYRLNGSNLWLTPIPASGQTVQVWYIPEPSSLFNDSDTVDGVSGWEEYIIIDAAIKARIKEESDITPLAMQKAEMIKRVEAMAQNRDAGNPATVGDSQYNDFWFPTGSGSGSGGFF